MPRVLQLSPRLPFPLDDGGLIASWNLSRCLHHNGYEIDLVCFTRSLTAEAEARKPLSEVFSSVWPVVRNVERQYPVTLLRSFLMRVSYFTLKYASRRLAAIVRERLARSDYEATLIDSAYMGVYLPVIREHAGAAGKVVLREHNVEYELLERLAAGESNPLYRALLRREARLFRRFELTVAERADDVRMITSRDAEVLAAAEGGTPPGVLSPFIDMDKYQCDPVCSAEPYTLVCVGNMLWMPNTNGVVWFCENVWPRVVQAYPQAKFYVVGKNPPSVIQRLASPHVIVTGYVDDERPYIRRAHLFIVPLLEGSGIRIKILTAMAMGRPVLSTSIGAEGITWSGLRIEDTAEDWATHIIRHFKTRPAADAGAVEHIRRYYDWRRELRL